MIRRVSLVRITGKLNSSVVQRIEHCTSNAKVVGLNPTRASIDRTYSSVGQSVRLITGGS